MGVTFRCGILYTGFPYSTLQEIRYELIKATIKYLENIKITTTNYYLLTNFEAYYPLENAYTLKFSKSKKELLIQKKAEIEQQIDYIKIKRLELIKYLKNIIIKNSEYKKSDSIYSYSSQYIIDYNKYGMAFLYKLAYFKLDGLYSITSDDSEGAIFTPENSVSIVILLNLIKPYVPIYKNKKNYINQFINELYNLFNLSKEKKIAAYLS
jgi:hypothetical protein